LLQVSAMMMGADSQQLLYLTLIADSEVASK